MDVRKIAVLGSTGSVGTSTLDVVKLQPGRFEVVALAAARSLEPLARQIGEHNPALAAVLDAQKAKELEGMLPKGGAHPGWSTASRAMRPARWKAGADMVLSAMVGAAGLLPTYAALGAGITVALANKETLVAGGELVMAQAKKKPGRGYTGGFGAFGPVPVPDGQQRLGHKKPVADRQRRTFPHQKPRGSDPGDPPGGPDPPQLDHGS